MKAIVLRTLRALHCMIKAPQLWKHFLVMLNVPGDDCGRSQGTEGRLHAADISRTVDAFRRRTESEHVQRRDHSISWS